MAILKFPGCKEKQLDVILALLPDECGVFVEPFCGTASVGLAMAHLHRCERLVLQDINARLVSMLQRVQCDPDNLTAHVLEECRRYNDASFGKEEIYYGWREVMNEEVGTLAADAAVLLTNVTGFNGLMRESAAGKFNVSWGKRESVNADLLADKIQETYFRLTAVPTSIECVPYHIERAWWSEKAVCFVDSPWDETFGSYSGEAWGPTQQANLAMQLRLWAKMGNTVLAHNSNTPRVRALYHGCRQHHVAGKTCISQTASGRGDQPELLIEVRA